ncbi:hypothetical protein DQ353_01235 [Arthrobacter sp. AQ5-05]|uniref:hypothetical protein n=1 Tax=Arthrobacter sp. AQ5-05 TaxID=2184581 RepID=UPI000DCBACCA|nr:hypothetical protein [Arthrobacter sp. AQ5-05]RAX51044.1 hypothetical protein DQ353_01235 [Arthrobacter sp. AQ5-05]
MDSGQLVWIIVIAVVVLALLGLALFFAQRRKKEKDLEQAKTLREAAAEEELDAREKEARAARAEADAQQARVDADRLQDEARRLNHGAESARSSARERARHARSLDPDSDAGASRGQDPDDERQEPVRNPHRDEGTAER